MTQTDIETLLKDELHRIAPDIEINEIDRDEDLREEFDIDSLDFLNLVTALGKALNTPMPEADYPQMGTYNEMIAYLTQKTA
ncbi:acyl carrier protein [Profundibacter amoris]|uniref:Acyl carrier protein n=1 Tax=Profundibacter amoris TaxID=2171755 RepID=A0A347UEI0_9RHOB|nr:acyl carrier protein [Profundibacter amoris]AXX97258.1 acyl carrier protein [Profundibacter amoris]